MSNWTRTALPALPDPRISWPTEFALCEQDAGDFAILQPSKRLSENQEKEFTEHYHNALRLNSSSELRKWAKTAQILYEIKHETDPCPSQAQHFQMLSYLTSVKIISVLTVLNRADRRIKTLYVSKSTTNKSIMWRGLFYTAITKHGHSALSKLFEQRPKTPKHIHVSFAHRKRQHMVPQLLASAFCYHLQLSIFPQQTALQQLKQTTLFVAKK